MVTLLVWNSRGAQSSQGGMIVKKWDEVWAKKIKALVDAGPVDNVAFLMCEAGWAPWIGGSPVNVNSLYTLSEESTHYDAAKAGASPFCQGVGAGRRRRAFWIPWLKTLDTYYQNVRCSIGGLFVPSSDGDRSWLLNWVRSVRYSGVIRPILRVELGRLGGGLTVLMVHLTARQPKALEELGKLIFSAGKLFNGSPVLIVGDLNINLLEFDVEGRDPGKPPLLLPPSWRWLSTGKPTHTKGGELDWAVLYDPQQRFGTLEKEIAEEPSRPGAPTWNVSDHAVMRYRLA